MDITTLQKIELDRETTVKKFREIGELKYDREQSKRYAEEAFKSRYEDIKTKEDFICKGYFLIEKILGELNCMEEDNTDLRQQLFKFRKDFVLQNFSE
ncbi:MAG TPA: hypothetical protein PK079_24000 [Leptospiraceae bacterium]|nr:hypothetical protein [Leptospiraceae bacterium]HMW08565.1 hypothetical protein [Leptospiraceae bacterium]HMZ66492.1 hypothetical protein [Leptospiraceae bacterium]HNA10034.1 hypothetical protein [Leptospiraceae bacterium]HNC00247.1 hypothetical protein [Leptospiraceae bacterium]